MTGKEMRELDRLTNEIAELRKDKERLDWLELNSEPRRRCFDDWYRVGFNSPGGKTIREAIDAAIEAQKSKIMNITQIVESVGESLPIESVNDLPMIRQALNDAVDAAVKDLGQPENAPHVRPVAED